MRGNVKTKRQKKTKVGKKLRLRVLMKCVFSGEMSRAREEYKVDKMNPSSGSLTTRDFSVSGFSSRNGDIEQRPDIRNIEEAEISLRESSSLNYEEARVLLGRIEYQKGNVEAALHVFEGIDIAAATPKMKLTLARRGERRKKHSQDQSAPPMSIHAVSLLLEAIFLKAKSLQCLGRFEEAAQSCKVILDIFESSLPDGLPENYGADCKLQENVNNAVALLPELWKLADCPNEAILSYRRALLHPWNLDTSTIARIQKEFAICLLYCGSEATPPNLRCQMDGSFVPRNNIEEATLLLMILLRKVSLKQIPWDPSILDHLTFALSVVGDLKALANQLEELLPGILDRKERYRLLSLCYDGAGEEFVALNLLRKLLSSREDPNCIPALLLASKICGENAHFAGEGVNYARRALESLDKNGCNLLESTANRLLGVSLSSQSKSAVTDSDRVGNQTKALRALEKAGKLVKMKDPGILYHLTLVNAEQRKLEAALHYAKLFLKIDGGSNIKGWLLLARILSGLKRYVDSETIIDAALDQTGKWDQGELLRTKAKIQIAQGQLKRAIETYTQLLAVVQVQSKSFGSGKKLSKGQPNSAGILEFEVWNDLAQVYIQQKQWRDAEICLSKITAISPNSAARLHTAGVYNEGKGFHKHALEAFIAASAIDPTHVPSLVSAAIVLRQLDNTSKPVIRSLLLGALKLDRMNPSAWYNLGLLHKAEGTMSGKIEAVECFEAAAFLEDSMPVEPFR
ncbi:hypothetical protein ACFE04_014496 [Oxalis oulophora]